MKGKDYVEIPFPHESLEAAAKALQKTFPLIPDNAALHMTRYGTSYKGGRYRWKHDPILRYRTTTAMSEGQIEAFIRRYLRSEERRVGKECRSRWSQYHEKKKQTNVCYSYINLNLQNKVHIM